MPELIAALDGGGTKTELVWADAMGNLGRMRITVGCSPQDSPDWLTPLRQVLAALPNAPTRIVFGIPSFGEVPALDRSVTAEIARLCPTAATILNDVALAYQGAFPDRGGVLVLAGTGSMAIAEGPNPTMQTKALTAAQIDTLAQRLSETPIEPANRREGGLEAVVTLPMDAA